MSAPQEQPPAWLIERHGDVWDIRAFRIETGVVAWRHTPLPSGRAGARGAVAETWEDLGRLLDRAAEFDRECEARIASCRRRSRAREVAST